jgi:hypothetical protein
MQVSILLGLILGALVGAAQGSVVFPPVGRNLTVVAPQGNDLSIQYAELFATYFPSAFPNQDVSVSVNISNGGDRMFCPVLCSSVCG